MSEPTTGAGGQRLSAGFESIRPRGRPRKYPWDDWFDGQRHVLNSREHFVGIDVRSMRQQVLNEAAKRDFEVTTRIKVDPRGDGIDYLEVKPKPPAPKKRVNWDATLAELPRTFVQGVDFDCEVESMRVRVYQAAQRRNTRVRIERNKDGLSVYPFREELVTEMAPAEEAERDG